MSPVHTSEIAEYNAAIASAFAGASYSNIEVTVVDQNAPTVGKLADGVHPNATGFNDMAPVWLAGIDTALNNTPAPLVTINSVSSGFAYTVADSTNGQTIYIDRTYAVAGLPAAITDGKLIRTRNDDDQVTANPHLTFTLGQSADVYVAYSTSATSLPAWLAGFTDTGTTVTAAGAGSFKLYRKTFPAGQVSLGGNMRDTTLAVSNYFVVVDAAAPPANQAPTNVSLSAGSVAELQPVGTVVGAISTTDPDPGSIHTYTLSGADAASFSIAGSQLRTAASFDYATKSSYNITIRTTDPGGLFFEKPFTVSVTTGVPVRVFILAGQSNMVGSAVGSTFPAPYNAAVTGVPFFKGTVPGTTPVGTLTSEVTYSGGGQFGPELSFSADLRASSPNVPFAIIKYARGGTSLETDWFGNGTASPSGDGTEYARLQTVVTEGLNALSSANPGTSYTIAGFLWTQGESDAFQSRTTAQYQADLTTFIADVRANYGNIPFLFSRLCSAQTAMSASTRNQIRAAQDAVAAADADAWIVNTDTFPLLGDNLHFNGAGQAALGSAFANLAITSGAFPPSASTYPFTFRLETESYDAASGDISAEPSEPHLISLQNKWARYDGIDLTGIASLTANLAVGTTGKLEFRIGSPTGTKIGEVNVSGTGTDWRTFRNYTSAVTGVTGVHTLYIIGSGSHGGVIDYVDFSGFDPVPQTFGQWSGSVNWGLISVEQRDEDDDPDGDGRNNRTERALGTDPTKADQPTGFELRVAPQPGGATFTMYYIRHAPDETYGLVHSASLTGWSEAGVSTEQWDAASSRHFRTCSVTGPAGFATLRLYP